MNQIPARGRVGARRPSRLSAQVAAPQEVSAAREDADMAERHKSWASDAEHELRRICREQGERIRELEREVRRLRAEARAREAKPVALPLRASGGR